MIKKEPNLLKRSIRKCSSKLIAIVFFSFFINILMFVAPLHMLQIYDRVLVSRSEVTLLVLTILAIGLLVIYGILDAVRYRILTRVGMQFDELMSSRLYNLVFETAVTRPSVSAPQQLIRELDFLKSFIEGPAIIAFCDAPWVPVFLAVCFVLHPLLGLVAISGAVVIFVIAASNEFLTSKQTFEASRIFITAANSTQASIRNSEVVKALGMILGIKKKWTKLRNSALLKQSVVNERSGSIIAVSRFVRMSLQVLILAVGGYLAIQDQITPGTMIAASIIMGRALAPVEQAVSQWKSFLLVRDSYNRLNEQLDLASERPEFMDLPPPVGRVSLERIFVASPESNGKSIILQNVSLNFNPGTITGIVGPSGCGKSSLVRAIVGVWPALRGVVRYDGANIQNWSPEKLGPYVGYMPQDVELFSGTVAENISRFQEFDSNDVISAAKKAGVHDLILRLTDGYDTNIGEGGQALSGGQRQRIALARALYMDPKIIILDEPNSNLDSSGEKALNDAIIGAKESGATIVVVSHRPTFLAAADIIAVFNQGQMVKVGPREQILSELGGPKIKNSATDTTNT